MYPSLYQHIMLLCSECRKKLKKLPKRTAAYSDLAACSGLAAWKAVQSHGGVVPFRHIVGWDFAYPAHLRYRYGRQGYSDTALQAETYEWESRALDNTQQLK